MFNFSNNSQIHQITKHTEKRVQTNHKTPIRNPKCLGKGISTLVNVLNEWNTQITGITRNREIQAH